MICLDGHSLSIEALVEAARGAPVEIAEEGRARMAASRGVIEAAIREGRPVYGVTTGLGARSVEALGADELREFSLQTVRGRAHAVGAAEAREVVRASLVQRLNSLLLGRSGARVEVAEHLCACLNGGLTPVVGQVGSIGVADLVQNATAALALIGDGRMEDGSRTGASGEMMRAAGITPLALEPRDGLALVSHSGWVAGRAALAFGACETVFEAAQTAAALSLEGFRANLLPLDPRVLDAKPLPGQQIAAAGLRARLEGSALFDAGAARRLQDPLSLRNLAQIHGGLAAALGPARRVIEIELNGASDNPLAFAEDGEVFSGGAYFTTELGLQLEALARALLHVAMASLARLTKFLDTRLSDLPMFLARADSGSAGVAALMKPAEALVARMAKAAAPPPVWPSQSALGVEDCMTSAPLAAVALAEMAEDAAHLVAIELVIAAQAADLAGCRKTMGPRMAAVHKAVREISAVLDEDRPLGAEIEQVADRVRAGRFG